MLVVQVQQLNDGRRWLVLQQLKAGGVNEQDWRPLSKGFAYTQTLNALYVSAFSLSTV